MDAASAKGIIFTGAMVRALYDGRKTQTRRLLNPQPNSECVCFEKVFAEPPYFEARNVNGLPCYPFPDGKHSVSPFPPVRYSVGDKLYVREAAAIASIFSDVAEIRYKAHERASYTEFVGQIPLAKIGNDQPTWPKYRPSIHMPRAWSRLWLDLINVRVERLQEITEADALAEGIIAYEPTEDDAAEFSHVDGGTIWNSARDAYAFLWNTLHTKEGTRWEDNPWIVAPTFDVHHGNIDGGAK